MSNQVLNDELPFHKHPDSTELNLEQLEAVSGGLLGLFSDVDINNAALKAQVSNNLANMRHEMLKAVTQNLRC